MNQDALRGSGMNVSPTVDTSMREEVRRRDQEKWHADNTDAIAAYNERIKREGAFGDGVRDF